MKKVYLSGAMLALSSLVFGQINTVSENLKNYQLTGNQNNLQITHATNQNRAQGDIIISDDFSVPGNWITPADANGNQWAIGNSSPAEGYSITGAMASTTASNGFATFDGISTLVNGTVTVQDAVVELVQTIDCSIIPGVVLEFEQRYAAFNSDETIVEVSGDNGATWTEYVVNEEVVTNANAIQSTIILNISAVAGNSATVKIRFRWRELTGDSNFGSGYTWMVDDVKLTEAWNYEAALIEPIYRMGVGGTNANGLEYHYIPTTQISPIEYAGKIKNNGGLIQTGAKLDVNIMFAGSNVYSQSSATSDIALLATDSFAVMPAFTPAGLGIYDVTMTATQTNTENNLADNEVTHSFEVTEYTFGRDNGIETGGISNVSSNTGLNMSIGNIMNVFADGVIGAVDIKLTSNADNVDRLMFGAVYLLNAAGDAYDWLGQTDDYTITNADNGGFVKLVFSSPISVTTGQEILIVAGHQGEEVEFAYAQGTEQGTVLGFTDGGSSLFSLTGGSAIMIRADMRDFTGVEEAVVSNISVAQNVPNPFNGNTTINYNLNNASNVSLEIVDIAGKVIATINEGNQTAGAHNITIDGSAFAQGTYFYTFTAGNYQVTKKMVVKK